MHLEIKLQRFAGLERRLQGINPVAELLIGKHVPGWPVEADGRCVDRRLGGEMDGVDRVRARVHEMERAADLGLPPLGIDLNAQVGAGQLRAAECPCTVRSAAHIRRDSASHRRPVRYAFSTFVL